MTRHMHISAYAKSRQDALFVRMFRQDALAEQDGRCHYCKSGLTVKTATADHKWPRCRYGANSRQNIAAACFDCNQAKGSMSEGQFFAAIKDVPGAATPFHIMRAWMRRKINIQANRSVTRIERLFLPASLRSQSKEGR